MRKVIISKLLVPSFEAVETFTTLYTALREAAIRENDLRSFVVADFVLATLSDAQKMLVSPQLYYQDAFFYLADPDDATMHLHNRRLAYVENYVIACG